MLKDSLKIVQGYYGPGRVDPDCSSSAQPDPRHSSTLNGCSNLQSGQTGAKLEELIKNSAKMAFKCPNEECVIHNITFMTEAELNSHIKSAHKCIKPSCAFASCKTTRLEKMAAQVA